MADFTSLKGFANYGESLTSDILGLSLISFFQWGLLGKGAFTNINLPSSGAYGGQASVLRLANDPRYNAGQVWEGFRQDWVWETGVEYAYQPINFSGVWVNGAYQPLNGTGTFAHTVNYPLGRVIFQTPIPASSVVQAEYSYRNVHISPADTAWFQAIQFNSFRIDDSQFLQQGSGAWNVLAENRVQLPAIVVEPLTHIRRLEGYELGSMTRIHHQDVVFSIFAETTSDRNKLHDIIINQWPKRIYGIDKNRLLADDKFPLDYNGNRVSGALMYPSLVAETGIGGYRWGLIEFERMHSDEGERTPRLMSSYVRTTFLMYL